MRATLGLEVSVRVIRTTGDRQKQAPLPSIGTTGIFTKEIETALLDGVVDVAVHSLKDLPTRLADGLALRAVPAREDPADALVAAPGLTLDTLPQGGEVMTGSPRRRAQVRPPAGPDRQPCAGTCRRGCADSTRAGRPA